MKLSLIFTKQRRELLRTLGVFFAAAIVLIPAILPYDTSLSGSMVMLMGGSSTLVGSLSITYYLSAVAAIFAPMLLVKIGSARKMAVLGILGLAAVSLISLAVVWFFFDIRGAWIFTGVTFLYGMLYGGLVCTGTAVMSKHNIPDRVYPLYNPVQVSGTFLCSALAAWAMNKLLTDDTIGVRKTYVLVFAVSALLLVGAAMIYLLSRLNDPEPPTKHEKINPAIYFSEIKDIFSHRDSRVFVICSLLFIFLWTAKSMYISMGYERNYEEMASIYQQSTAIALVLKAALFFIFGFAAKKLGNRPVLLIIAVICALLPLAAQYLPFSCYELVIIASNIPPMACVFLTSQMFIDSTGGNYAVRYVLFTLLPMPISLLMPALGKLAEGSPLTVNILQFAAALAVVAVLIIDCARHPMKKEIPER